MAIQFRRGTDAEWETNNSNIVSGEPVITEDTGRFFFGIGAGSFVELPMSKEDYRELAVMMASPHSENATYFEGQFATHGGGVYSAKQDITTAEPWDSSKWDYIGAAS